PIEPLLRRCHKAIFRQPDRVLYLRACRSHVRGQSDTNQQCHACISQNTVLPFRQRHDETRFLVKAPAQRLQSRWMAHARRPDGDYVLPSARMGQREEMLPSLWYMLDLPEKGIIKSSGANSNQERNWLGPDL